MCGIAGIALSNNTLGDLETRLLAMRDAMTHRGPDDAGLFVSDDGCVGLANRRLAIRDLSPAGHMPMGNEACTARAGAASTGEPGRSACTEQGRSDGAVWITYNGEIYNTDELRPELERLGYTFRSSSDTEVILHGYEAWGAEIVTRLRGMFAFAVYDARPSLARPRLFIARDRLGIKPLYYARAGSALLFASELKGMLASGLLSREVSPTAVAAYLMTGSVPAPLTIYEGIEALEPGCALTWDGGRIEIHRYWDFPYEMVEPESYSKAVEQIRALLEESVRIRLVSDVPLGAFLSGGLDSSAVVALMRRGTDGPIRTCSMTFEESEFSEAPYARAMADAVGAEHYERVITPQHMADELARIFWAMDQPTIDGVNTYFVSQTAREAGLTVALSGLGGDELFGGYANTFQGVPQMLKVMGAVRAVPGAAALAGAAIGLLPDRQRWAKVKDALSRPASPASAYLARRGLFSPAEVKSLVTPDVWHAAKSTFDPIRHIADRAESRPANGSGNQLFSWVSRAELRTYTHHQLLRDTDVMSMSHSLEVRVPLLDHRLVEAVMRLPDWMKKSGHGPKPLLLAAVGDLLPPVVRDRRVKQGFTFPFERWLRGQLQSRIEQALSAGVLGSQRLYQPETVQRVWKSYLDGRLHWSRPWALAAFALWSRGAASDLGIEFDYSFR